MPGRLACLFVSLALFVAAAHADPAEPRAPGPWDYSATVGLNLSQSAFSDNWVGGDKGQFTWVLNSDIGMERQFTPGFRWSNRWQLAYGQTARQSADAAGGRRWDVPEKSTDLLAMESVARWTLNRFVDPFASVRLETQFADESSPLGTLRFNPVRIQETAGLARLLAHDEEGEILTRLGFGFRQTVARSFVDSTTRATESFSSNDGGVEWKTTASWPLARRRIHYKGSLTVFQPVFYSKASALEDFDARAGAADPGRGRVADFWKTADVSFESVLTGQVTKVVAANLYFRWMFDKFSTAANVDPGLPLPLLVAEIDRNVRRAGQYKETLAIGLIFQLF